jgi:cysteinyl-tRNA synthetase
MSEAIAILWGLIKDNLITAGAKINTVMKFDEVLGLSLFEKSKSINKFSENIPAEITKYVKERDLAKKNRDWKKADEIRNKILILGYEIIDTESGAQITKK